MGAQTGRDVSRHFGSQSNDANHAIASALARRERALALRHEERELEAVDLADRHHLFGRLTARMGQNALDTRRRLEAMAETEDELQILRPFAETYVELSGQVHEQHGRRMFG
ncbi:hypothetical protein [Gordonia terrae]|uniref:hypothetical protein n=1 Tax=Gordonia terrae TaxID=2055 RepID=UPI0012681EFB|nr:hypothetical protein [Gordonia terrae]